MTPTPGWPERDEALPWANPPRADVLFVAGRDWRWLDSRRLRRLAGPRGQPPPARPARLRGRTRSDGTASCATGRSGSAPAPRSHMRSQRPAGVRGPVFTIPNGNRPARSWMRSRTRENRTSTCSIAGGQAAGPGTARSRSGWRPPRRALVLLSALQVAPGLLLEQIARARVTLFLPNPREGFYIPALEGMALGTLVVCPDCDGKPLVLQRRPQLPDAGLRGRHDRRGDRSWALRNSGHRARRPRRPAAAGNGARRIASRRSATPSSKLLRPASASCGSPPELAIYAAMPRPSRPRAGGRLSPAVRVEARPRRSHRRPCRGSSTRRAQHLAVDRARGRRAAGRGRCRASSPPLDPPGRDRVDERRRHARLRSCATLHAPRAADAPGVQQVDLHAVRGRAARAAGAPSAAAAAQREQRARRRGLGPAAGRRRRRSRGRRRPRPRRCAVEPRHRRQDVLVSHEQHQRPRRRPRAQRGGCRRRPGPPERNRSRRAGRRSAARCRDSARPVAREGAGPPRVRGREEGLLGGDQRAVPASTRRDPPDTAMSVALGWANAT